MLRECNERNLPAYDPFIRNVSHPKTNRIHCEADHHPILSLTVILLLYSMCRVATILASRGGGGANSNDRAMSFGFLPVFRINDILSRILILDLYTGLQIRLRIHILLFL